LFVVVAEERVEQRWVGAPRKLCHVATHEITYNNNEEAGGDIMVLLLGLRSCEIPKTRGAKLPSPEELSELITSAGGPSGRFTHAELPSGFKFLA
jgi:hypothetical protein